MARNSNIQVRADVTGERAIEQLNQTLQHTASGTNQLGEEALRLSQQLDVARVEAVRLKRVWEQDPNNEASRMAYVRQCKAVKQLEQELARLAANGAHHHATLATSAQQHEHQLNQIEQSLREIRPSLAEVARDMGDIFQAAGKVSGFGYLAHEAMKFESAMASVKKVTDATPEQLNELSGSLKNMAGELGIMPDQLAEIAAAGGQMGLAFNDLPKFTEMAANMSNAFGITADEAGDMAAKIANVYQISIDEVAELGDVINTLGNTTAAKEAEIGNVLKRIGGNAKQFGLMKEEAAALSAAFISLGKSPEEAGTAINAMLTKLQTATEQGGDFKSALKDIGLSAEELATNIAGSPQAALTDFLQRIEKLDKQSRSIVLTKMFGAEYSDDLALLSGGLKTYSDALETATDKTQTFGAMQNEAAAALETTEGKMNKAKADIAAASIDLGNALLPVIQAAAGAVGGMAKAISAVTERFPVLSQLAVLFVGAKVACTAVGTAMKLAGFEGATAFLKADVGVTRLRASLAETATAARTLGANIRAATVGNVNDIQLGTNAVSKLGSKLAGVAKTAVSMFAAFETGYGIGTELRENFTWVRDVGDELGRMVAYVDAIFTDRTFDDVRKFYRTTREEEKENAKASKEAAEAANKRKEAEAKAAKEQAAKIQALSAEYKQQQKHLSSYERSMKTLESAGKSNSQMYADLKKKHEELAPKIAKTKEELDKLNAKIGDASPLAKNRQALNDLGLTAEEVSSGISKSAQDALDNFKLAAETFGNDADSVARIFSKAVSKMDSPEALAALKKSLTEAGQNAGLTAEQIDLIALAGDKAGLHLASISKELGVAETAAEAMGISLESALNGVTPTMQATLTQFQAIRSQLDGLAAQGIDTGQVLEQALAKMIDSSKNQADIDALKNQIKSLGQDGKLSAKQIKDALLAAEVKMAELAAATSPVAQAFKTMGIQSKQQIELQIKQAEAALKTIQKSGNATEQALEQARKKVQELKNALDPTASAFERLGIKTKDALKEAAEQQMKDFERVKESGKATQEDLKKAFETTANAMLASGDVSQRAWVQSRAAAYQYTLTVDDSGKAALQAAAKTQEAAQKQVSAHNAVAQSAAQATDASKKQAEGQKDVAKSAEDASKSYQNSSMRISEATYTAGQRVKGMFLTIDKWCWVLGDSIKLYKQINQVLKDTNVSMQTGVDLSDNLARMEDLANSNARTLGQNTLDKLRTAIADAKKKMQEFAEEAANARKEAEKSLLSAQGKTDEVAKLEQQEKIDALVKKREAAEKMGNSKAAGDYQAAIAAQQQAFAEQKRREAEQRAQELAEKQRQEREQAEREAKQKREQLEREAQQRAAQEAQRKAVETPSNVEIGVDTAELAELLQARDGKVADAAVSKLMEQLKTELSRQR